MSPAVRYQKRTLLSPSSGDEASSKPFARSPAQAHAPSKLTGTRVSADRGSLERKAGPARHSDGDAFFPFRRWGSSIRLLVAKESNTSESDVNPSQTSIGAAKAGRQTPPPPARPPGRIRRSVSRALSRPPLWQGMAACGQTAWHLPTEKLPFKTWERIAGTAPQSASLVSRQNLPSGRLRFSAYFRHRTGFTWRWSCSPEDGTLLDDSPSLFGASFAVHGRPAYQQLGAQRLSPGQARSAALTVASRTTRVAPSRASTDMPFITAMTRHESCIGSAVEGRRPRVTSCAILS